MKKILYYILFSLLLLQSCSSTDFQSIKNSFTDFSFLSSSKEDKYKDNLRKYKLQAKIITNKGDINVFLYPEEAPETVANFVYLAKKNFYDNMKFHRVVPNAIIQSGDSKGDTTGTAGYYIKDEMSDWLNFNVEGILAMANTGQKGTASSQFFITLVKNSNYNGHYAAFGNLVSKEDMQVARSIVVGDYIKDIEISGINVNSFLNNFKAETKKWDTMYLK